jgi:hypothetical protein
MKNVLLALFLALAGLADGAGISISKNTIGSAQCYTDANGIGYLQLSGTTKVNLAVNGSNASATNPVPISAATPIPIANASGGITGSNPLAVTQRIGANAASSTAISLNTSSEYMMPLTFACGVNGMLYGVDLGDTATAYNIGVRITNNTSVPSIYFPLAGAALYLKEIWYDAGMYLHLSLTAGTPPCTVGVDFLTNSPTASMPSSN